jgi:thymidylate synthase ThyX
VSAFRPEPFSPEERAKLAPWVTDPDAQVFGLVGLREEVVAALMARYSRTARSLRRTLLEEFLDEAAEAGQTGAGSGRAQSLLDRVIGEYGDDSVAQLAVVHLAVEQIPALLARRLERGRLAAYLEQSTRYVPLTQRREDGSWPAWEPPDAPEELLAAYRRAIDASFVTYVRLFEGVSAYLASIDPPQDAPGRRAQRAAALDAARGMLPLAVLTNVGVVASAQAAERLVWRLRADETPGAPEIAEQIAAVLRQLVPGLTQRMDREDRGGRMVEYLRETRAASEPAWQWTVAFVEPAVELVGWDPDAEASVGGWLRFEQGVAASPAEERDRLRGDEVALDAVFADLVGTRENRRHLPGRALEAAVYEAVVACDVGVLRDLARHRLLSLFEPPIAPGLGFCLHPLVVEAGLVDMVRSHLERLGELVLEVREAAGPHLARLLLPMATQTRFGMIVNARELMHLVELRSQPQGHWGYRRVAAALWESVRAVGHHRIAQAMSFVDPGGYTVGRLEAERRAEERGRTCGKDHAR